MSIKFNLERALRGDEVVNRDGDRVSNVTFSNKLNPNYPVMGVVCGVPLSYDENGFFDSPGCKEGEDLYMKYPSTDSPRKFTELDTQIRFPEGQLIL